MISKEELYWCAGFLEGEGYFAAEQKTGSLRIRATQVQREPLERLCRLMGGSINDKTMHPETHRQSFSNWGNSGVTAAGWMMTLYSIMSPRRRAQISAALKRWAQRPVAAKFKTCCLRGHQLDGNNIRLYPGGRKGALCKHCQPCTKMRTKMRRARDRELTATGGLLCV